MNWNIKIPAYSSLTYFVTKKKNCLSRQWPNWSNCTLDMNKAFKIVKAKIFSRTWILLSFNTRKYLLRGYVPSPSWEAKEDNVISEAYRTWHFLWKWSGRNGMNNGLLTDYGRTDRRGSWNSILFNMWPKAWKSNIKTWSVKNTFFFTSKNQVYKLQSQIIFKFDFSKC